MRKLYAERLGDFDVEINIQGNKFHTWIKTYGTLTFKCLDVIIGEIIWK